MTWSGFGGIGRSLEESPAGFVGHLRLSTMAG